MAEESKLAAEMAPFQGMKQDFLNSLPGKEEVAPPPPPAPAPAPETAPSQPAAPASPATPPAADPLADIYAKAGLPAEEQAAQPQPEMNPAIAALQKQLDMLAQLVAGRQQQTEPAPPAVVKPKLDKAKLDMLNEKFGDPEITELIAGLVADQAAGIEPVKQQIEETMRNQQRLQRFADYASRNPDFEARMRELPQEEAAKLLSAINPDHQDATGIIHNYLKGRWFENNAKQLIKEAFERGRSSAGAGIPAAHARPSGEPASPDDGFLTPPVRPSDRIWGNTRR